MATVAYNLKSLAEAADDEANSKVRGLFLCGVVGTCMSGDGALSCSLCAQGQPAKHLADCVEQLRTCFRNVSQGKGTQIKSL